MSYELTRKFDNYDNNNDVGIVWNHPNCIICD